MRVISKRVIIVTKRDIRLFVYVSDSAVIEILNRFLSRRIVRPILKYDIDARGVEAFEVSRILRGIAQQEALTARLLKIVFAN